MQEILQESLTFPSKCDIPEKVFERIFAKMRWRIDMKGKVKDFLLLNFGVLLNVVGIYFFKFPNHFSTGGVSGLSIVLGNCIHFLSPATMVTIINILLLLIGFAVFGKGFGFRTTYTSLAMSFGMQILEWVYPMEKPFTNQPLLELFFGMMLSDAGYGLMMLIGTTVVLKKFTVEGTLRRSLTMFRNCAVSTLFWGILFGSWFGDLPQTIASNFFGYTITSTALWFQPLDDPTRDQIHLGIRP